MANRLPACSQDADDSRNAIGERAVRCDFSKIPGPRAGGLEMAALVGALRQRVDLIPGALQLVVREFKRASDVRRELIFAVNQQSERHANYTSCCVDSSDDVILGRYTRVTICRSDRPAGSRIQRSAAPH
jgi:hypothetical protein